MRTVDPTKVGRILDAAIQLFAEKAYHEVRMEDIAVRAKVAKGTLYLHFKDKESLYLALMSEGLRSMLVRMRQKLTDEMPVETKLQVIIGEGLEYTQQNRFFMDLMQSVEMLRIGTRSVCFEASRGELQALIAETLLELDSFKGRSASEIVLEVLAFGGMMKEILHNLPQPWGKDLAAKIARIFLYGVSGSAAGSGDRSK